MNEDDSFRMLDDKDVFYVCMLLFMFALVFGGCSQEPEEEFRSAYLRPCDATVSDRLHYADAKSERCYFFKSAR